MKFRKILTWSTSERKARLFRIYWNEGHNCLSFALMPNLLKLDVRYRYDFRIVLLGVSVHYMRSFGGRFA